MSAVDKLLSEYRAAAVSEREKGTYFERLARAYLLADPIQSEEFSEVWSWSEWAKEQAQDGRDVGIDLVAKLRNGDGYAAIQAKFYAPNLWRQWLGCAMQCICNAFWKGSKLTRSWNISAC